MANQTRYLEEVRQRVLVYDGAMGTTIQRLNLVAADYGGEEYDGCPEILAVTRPDVVSSIHTAYLEAGCDVLETDTFTGTRLKLDDYKLGHRTLEINRAAAALARAAADRFSTPEQPRFVAGSMGPTGMLPSSDDPALSNITYQQLAEIYREQAAALMEGGVDLLLIETSQDILEVRAAIAGIRRAFAAAGRTLPIQAQVTLDTSGRMLLGTDIAAAAAILRHLRVDVIGLNCSTGPEHMREPVRYLTENIPLPISTIPNAGLPLNVNGQAVYPMEPAPLADALGEFVSEFGVNIVGGCCGTTPEHIRQVIARLGALKPDDRHKPVERLRRFAGDPAAAQASALAVASAIRATPLVQVPAPLLVGERVNSTGSRKAKQALLEDDYDALLVIAREQVESGAHVLDVQVALTERADEVEQMRRTVKKLEMGIEAPLVIDTTEANVVQAALETYPGRAIINSINLENGRQRVDAVLPLAREHGAAVVALTIDEEGMAKSAERKLAVAERIHAIATSEYDLEPSALIFDTLTFPVTTGQEDLRDSAVQTIEGIRGIKAALPGVLTILGVSNVSFGIKPHARAVLNSVFLHHAVAAGLDAAIVNPAHITPYAEIPEEQRALADDLLLNRSEDALPRFIAYFEEHGATAKAEEAVDPTAGMSIDQRLHYQILHRKKAGVEDLIDAAVAGREAGVEPGSEGAPARPAGAPAPGEPLEGWQTTSALSHAAVNVLNDVLLPAMKDVGDRFGAGELILPFVLQSAEVMKRAVAHLERYLERAEGYTKGKVVLATVFGDVHDIGKNLVNTILSNNGYTVYDLGKQVPLNTILDKAVEVQADAIGLSALLVSTSKQMPLCVQELHRRGMGVPVIIGGAAINRAYGRRILFVGDGAQPEPYGPGVYYARDAFEGLEIMDQLTTPERRPAFVARIQQEAQQARQAPASAPGQTAADVAAPAPSIAPVAAPTPPFWGPRVLDRVGLEDVAECLDRNALFRGQWGGKAHGAEFQRLVREEFEPRLARMLREARLRQYLHPKAVYGYFPARAEGNDLTVYDPVERDRAIERFTFPRQPGGERLCLTDYFQTPDGSPGVVALQVVTMGARASEAIEQVQAAGDYAEAYFVHGFSVQMAEAMAEYVNRQVRRDLGLPPTGEQGRRYSWGYAAIPDLADHERVFKLLSVPEAIGVALTEAYQLVPEQSTAAIVVSHPGAVYFAVRE
jgi:5-methyltetrahydrofolate--homocysteine methyltransferase